MRRRGTLAVFVLILMGVVGAGSAWSVWAWRLPSPSEANREQLLRWLVLRDVSAETAEIQRTLVNRLVDELKDDTTMTGQAVELSDSYRERLIDNLECLKAVWFSDRVATYHNLAREQRIPYLEEQIDTIMIWATVDLGTSDAQADEQAQRHAFTMQFFGDVERWIAGAEPGQAKRMSAAVQAGLTCWLATRSLEDEPMATRRDLADRISAELDRGLRLDSVLSELSLEQQELLRSNAWLLLEAWLHNESDRFADLPPDQQLAFVDAQIDRLMTWRFVELFGAESEASPTQLPSQTVVQLLANVEQWIQRADAEQQAKMRSLVEMIQQQWMLRSLQGIFGG